MHTREGILGWLESQGFAGILRPNVDQDDSFMVLIYTRREGDTHLTGMV